MRYVRPALAALLVAISLHATSAGAETPTTASISPVSEDFVLANASNNPSLQVPGLAVLLLSYATPQAGSLILFAIAGAGLFAIGRRRPSP